jgi:pimeloyl-ACP methyl ester carboxylesterase
VLPFDEDGTGPAVVLLHAGIADRRMWAEHVPALAGAGFRVIAPELPGFGEALPAPGPQAPWEDVLSLLAKLDVERAALVGNSFGGAVALRMAVVAPAAVSSLVLVSAPPVAMDPSPQLAAAWAAEEAALERGDTEAAVAAVVDAWTLPDAPAELRERLAAMQRRTFELQGTGGEWTDAPDPLDADPDAIARVDVPALVLAGEHDMPDFVEGAELLAAALPNARHEVIPGAGHLAPLETPERFRALLLDFLG